MLSDEAREIDDGVVGKAEELAVDLDRFGEGDLATKLRYAVQWRRLPDVGQEARDRIHARTPRFLVFGDADRSLLGEYDIQGDGASNPAQLWATLDEWRSSTLFSCW